MLVEHLVELYKGYPNQESRNIVLKDKILSLRSFTMYTLTKNIKFAAMVCVFSALIITFVSSVTEAGCGDRSRLWESILQKYGFSTDTPEQIIDAAKNGNWATRHMAMLLLTSRVGEKAKPTLKEGLDDEHVVVRWGAAHLLGTLNDKSGLERMRLDFKELVPRNGASEPVDPDIAKNAQTIEQWRRHRRYRITKALEVGKVLAELGDRRGYELAAREAIVSSSAARRSRAVKVLAEIAKTDGAILAAEGRDPVFVLCAVAESEKRMTVFIDAVMAAEELGGNIGIQILDKAKDSPYQSEQVRSRVKNSLKRLESKM